MTGQTPSYLEDRVSQIPALRLLMAMGWEYLPPDEALSLRGGKYGNVILGDVLREWLGTHNVIRHKGKTVAFSEANVNAAIRDLEAVPLQKGLIPASEEMYELLTLGKSAEQTIDGDRRSYSINYIDWEHPEHNYYHVTEEFTVERRGSYQTRRPDIVLFVNGIPLAVIECKRPDQSTTEGKPAVYDGVSQMLRNQRLEDEIPHLFAYAQVLVAVSVNEALYGTTMAKAKYWGQWNEEGDIEALVEELANTPLSDAMKARLYDWRDDGHWVLNILMPRTPPGTACRQLKTGHCTVYCIRRGCWKWRISTLCMTVGSRKSPDTNSFSQFRRRLTEWRTWTG